MHLVYILIPVELKSITLIQLLQLLIIFKLLNLFIVISLCSHGTEAPEDIKN